MDANGELLQRFDGPRAYGHWQPGDYPEASGSAEDHSQLVWVRFDLQLSAGRIGAVRFHVLGCPHTMAATSWVAESLVGQPVGALEEVDAQALKQAFAVPQEKLGRLLVIEDAARECAAQLGSHQ
jgi:NifU-like protein involved in Fe-S cluster formation